MTTCKCSCDLRAVREECCGRARWLQETRTTFGCGFMEKRRDSSGGRKIRTICVLRRMASRRLPSVAPEPRPRRRRSTRRSEEHTSELQSHVNLVCRLLLEKKKQIILPFHCLRKKKKTPS